MKEEPRLLPNGRYTYPVYVFYKFQTKDRLLDLQKNGHIYMKNLDYYIKLEQSTGDSNIGDAKEGRAFCSSIKLVPESTGKVINLGKCDVRFGDVIKKPVYCLTCIDVLDYITDINETKIECIPVFDEKILNAFKRDQEELYVLIIDAASFNKKIRDYLINNNMKYDSGFVDYRDTSIFYKDGEEIFVNGLFHKREKYSYQKEFRYAIDKKIERNDKYDFYIDDISDISHLCKAKDLLKDTYKYILELEQ